MRALLTLFVATVTLSAWFGTTTAAPGDPVPDIGITIEQGGPTSVTFGSPDRPPLPGDFFGPGSDPFIGPVSLQSACRAACPCDDDCDGVPDSELGYRETSSSDWWDTEMLSLPLHSISPIEVTTNGTVHVYNLKITLSGQAAGFGSPPTGALQLPPGASLQPGSSSFVVDSFFDIIYRLEFSDPATGSPVGTPIEANLRLHLQETDLPVARADAASGGAIILGSDGSTIVPFTYASTGGGFQFSARSVGEPPVSTQSLNWGSVKSLFR